MSLIHVFVSGFDSSIFRPSLSLTLRLFACFIMAIYTFNSFIIVFFCVRFFLNLFSSVFFLVSNVIIRIYIRYMIRMPYGIFNLLWIKWRGPFGCWSHCQHHLSLSSHRVLQISFRTHSNWTVCVSYCIYSMGQFLILAYIGVCTRTHTPNHIIHQFSFDSDLAFGLIY